MATLFYAVLLFLFGRALEGVEGGPFSLPNAGGLMQGLGAFAVLFFGFFGSLIYAGCSAIVTALLVAVYNALAGIIGGVEVELGDESEKPARPLIGFSPVPPAISPIGGGPPIVEGGGGPAISSAPPEVPVADPDVRWRRKPPPIPSTGEGERANESDDGEQSPRS